MFSVKQALPACSPGPDRVRYISAAIRSGRTQKTTANTGHEMQALIISADQFEDSELIEPLRQLQARGVRVAVAAPERKTITGKHGGKVDVDLDFESVRPDDYHLLILPGGAAPASLKKDSRAVALVRHFLQTDKPVAAICHGPQLLVAAVPMAGRRATGYHDIRGELRAAGVHFEDREVMVDGNLITSRRPADIPAFMREIFKIMRLDA